jgi:hypothetical protein
VVCDPEGCGRPEKLDNQQRCRRLRQRSTGRTRAAGRTLDVRRWEKHAMMRRILRVAMFAALLTLAIPASTAWGYYGGCSYGAPAGCYYYYHIWFRGAPSPQFLHSVLPRNDTWRRVYYYRAPVRSPAPLAAPRSP